MQQSTRMQRIFCPPAQFQSRRLSEATTHARLPLCMESISEQAMQTFRMLKECTNDPYSVNVHRAMHSPHAVHALKQVQCDARPQDLPLPQQQQLATRKPGQPQQQFNTSHAPQCWRATRNKFGVRQPLPPRSLLLHQPSKLQLRRHNRSTSKQPQPEPFAAATWT